MIFNLGGGAAAPKLTSIAVTTNPTTTTYAEGESFNKSGMVVTAYFDDGSSSIVTGYTFSPTTVPFGSSNITISYTVDEITKTAVVAVKGRRYLYKSGNEYQDVTGGWVTYAQMRHSNSGISSTAHPTIKRNATSIKFSNSSWTAGSVALQNKIDLTGVKTLVAKGTIYSSTGDGKAELFVKTSTNGWAESNAVANYAVPVGSTVNMMTLDVSSLSGKYYIFFHVAHLSTIELTEFYGE